MRKKNREVKDQKELNSIFKEADVCRIALIDGDVPYIVVMNFGYSELDNAIYFHCAKEGRKIDIIKKNNIVCFQVDTDHELINTETACEYTMNYKSIVGTGVISIVEDEKERNYGLNVLMKHYSDKKDHIFDDKVMKITHILKLKINEMTGKKKN